MLQIGIGLGLIAIFLIVRIIYLKKNPANDEYIDELVDEDVH